MWWRLLFSRLFLQLLRILLIPAVALIFGIFILLLLAIISYVYVFTNTIQMIPQHPILGVVLTLLEIAIFIGIVYGMYKGYHHLREKVHHKLQEANK